MKNQVTILFAATISIFTACSKSSSDTTPPTPPPPVVKNDSVTVTHTSVSYVDVQTSEYPILSSSMATSLYVGRIIKESDTSNMYSSFSKPVADTNVLNKATIYTTLPTDSISRTDFPSYALNQSYFNGILKNNKSAQIGNFIFSDNNSKSNIQFRFNVFRNLLGVNEDMNTYLNLGFADTSAIDKKNKVVYLQMEQTRFYINCEPPIYDAFIKIPKTNSSYNNLFGAGEPKIVSSIAYGISYVIAIMVDSSKTNELATAVNNFKNEMGKPTKDYNNLSTADKQIFKNAKVYAVALGQDKKNYANAEDALTDMASALKKITNDLTYGGYPIRYSLSNVSNFDVYKRNFKLAQYADVTEKVPKN
ncbi:MAG TPA: hypothetical protein VGB84_06490 [Arachidicoccus sp.]